MKELLEKINAETDEAGGALSVEECIKYREKYRDILQEGEKECPKAVRAKGKRGRPKQTKSRNLLNRLKNFEDDTLRFMENKIVPFTNNLGENALRMTKVQQKISGCFRSMDGAYMFCRIRGYLSTCRKQGVSASEGVRLLFLGKIPNFIDSS